MICLFRRYLGDAILFLKVYNVMRANIKKSDGIYTGSIDYILDCRIRVFVRARMPFRHRIGTRDKSAIIHLLSI